MSIIQKFATEKDVDVLNGFYLDHSALYTDIQSIIVDETSNANIATNAPFVLGEATLETAIL